MKLQTSNKGNQERSVRVYLQPRFVILSAAKNPAGSSLPLLCNVNPDGFFAALRMTGFEDSAVFKTLPGDWSVLDDSLELGGWSLELPR
jgi:hypothetical protein